MNAPSFLKRLVRSVVTPSERRRAQRQARQAIELCHALLSERGEVSGAVLARDALAAYNALRQAALPAFFDRLVARIRARHRASSTPRTPRIARSRRRTT